MQKFLFIKLAIIGTLCLFFVIALMMINGLVNERKAYADTVIDEIAQTQIGKQTLITPFIVIDDNGSLTPVLADSSTITGDLAVKDDQYARGIYKATSYQGAFSIKQSYALPSLTATSQPQTTQTTPSVQTSQTQPVQTTQAGQGVPFAPSQSTAQTSAQTTTQANAPKPTKPKTATLIIPVSDLRGVVLPTVTADGKELLAKFADKELYALGHSNYLTVPLNEVKPTMEIDFNLELAGLSGINFVPLGQNSSLSLKGNWTEPKFFGNALPTQKTLNETGFDATWQTPFLAQQNNSSLNSNFENCEHCSTEHFSTISTDFVDTSNAYTKTDRTIKYALILLLVSFGTFFLFEVIKGLKIHPIQYLLVSSGLLIFYVLLLSLAELIVFWQAYLMASVACVSLITWYASFMLKSSLRSLVFGTILSGLYAGFYVILSASEMNLLLGSVFCFVLLFVVMFITRKIDWYAIGNKADDIDDDNDHYHNDETEHTSNPIHQGA